tara:strand:+ start:60 stop:299 length:240 start_codon:yes stop_codon:yes gene_type:complete
MGSIQTEDRRFLRDTHSKALLNTDYNALQQHRREKLYFQKQQNDINILRKQVEELTTVRGEIIEIRTLLTQIIDQKKEL